MTLLRVRRAAQLTLPAEARRALNLKDGDYLEAEVVKGTLVLRPVAVVDRAKAWRQVFSAMGKVRDLRTAETRKTASAEDLAIEAVAEHRRRSRKRA